jgi:uracil-DNA glycosylase
MHLVHLVTPIDLDGWRSAARRLYMEGIAPEHVTWCVTEAAQSLFSHDPGTLAQPQCPPFTVPKEFLTLAGSVVLHRDEGRFALLYRLLCRLRGEARLLSDAMDRDVHHANALAAAVRRDIHKMHAFVRFREVHSVPRGFAAWFEPSHYIIEAAAPFFVQRFPNTAWAILTPYRRAIWDRQVLSFGPGASRSEVPAEDAAENLWRQYYTSIFNPARLNMSAMRLHMPQKYWRNLPETQLIPQLVGTAHARTLAMIEKEPAVERRVRRRSTPAPAPVHRPERSLQTLRESALTCRACPLWKNATQTVFGEGARSAKIVMIGEQPGDQEDLAGRPFVGPAGRLLDRALEAAGIDRAATYVTNAVKHFKFEPRGKRRLHKKPNELEIAACHQWLERELELLGPELIVVLGATAARAVFGRATPIEKNRGRIMEPAQHGTVWPADILVTVHPSYLLRIDDADKPAALDRFVSDLQLARRYLMN